MSALLHEALFTTIIMAEILVVDDEETARYARACAESAGPSGSFGKGGVEGLEELLTNRPNLVLST